MTRSLRECKGTKRVLEVGPGTGAFTKSILNTMTAADSLDIVELNSHFCTILEAKLLEPFRRKHQCAQVRIYNCSVQDAPIDGPFDFVVCGLPFNNFTPTVVRSIFRRLMALLRDGGELVYFEYALIRELRAPLVGREGRSRSRRIEAVGKALRSRHKSTQELVIANVPPALAVRIVKSGVRRG